MQPISIVVLFCEDVREEKSEAHTIVGVMPDNISVSIMPITIVRLVIYIRIIVTQSFVPSPISNKLMMPDGSVHEFDTIDESFISKAQQNAASNESPISGIISRIVISPLVIQTPGRLNLITKVGEDEYVTGTLNIIYEGKPKNQSEG